MSNLTIRQVQVEVKGKQTILDYNSVTGKYEKTITAPSETSYGENSNHYYPITVKAIDSAGNITTKTDSDAEFGSELRLRVKETVAPTISITQPTASSYVTNSAYPIKFTVSDGSNGSGVNPDTIILTIDSKDYKQPSTGLELTKIQSIKGYRVVYTPPVGLSDGTHTIKINASDYDGNKAAQLLITYTIDTVAPKLEITEPISDNLYVNTVSYNLVGKTSDATSGISYVNVKVNGANAEKATLNPSSGDFTKNINLTEGQNSIIVRAVDMAGKYTEITRSLILDTAPPEIRSVTVEPNTVNTGQSYTITVEVTD